jgi:putative membrane-bound dehydrogenase-like protein
MRSLPHFTFFIASLLAVLSSASCLAQSPSSAVSLFDGKTLNGWESDPAYWRVENGAIVGEIPQGQTLGHNTWCVWRGGELTDFELNLQVKLTGAPAANSGIQFRCQVRDVNHVSGYQADLDMGTTWLGRIYDEHGRALLVERGARVKIDPDGTRHAETFAPANQYAVLFRENAWNDYRIVASGDRVSVYINGTLFSELQDQQTDQQDLKGSLAFQLHSGPETRVEFRNVQLETLKPGDTRLKPLAIRQPEPTESETDGVVPKAADGKDFNAGFEAGSLAGWTATGDAFNGQPVNTDGIASRWPGQTSNKNGQYFIGGYELVQDKGTGTLTSSPFTVTHPYASFLLSGGSNPTTRVEIFQPADGQNPESVISTAVGNQREQMRRIAVDLRKYKGQKIAVRLVDENAAAWGHLNFDDFRFHDTPPQTAEVATAWRSISNPLLQHLVPNAVASDKARRGTETVAQMFVPEGFSVDVIAAEPQLHQPMAFTFDAKGRLWVVEGHSYPQKRPEGEGLDRILIFADNDGDGQFEDRKTFIEGLNLVSGMEVGHGGVWVGAAPELLFIPDRDGDDKPDTDPQVLLNGFGYADTHETLNSLMWGPDGWLYGNQGVFNTSMIGKPGSPDSQRQRLSAGVWRYHPVKHTFEVFAHGGSNQWGLDYDDFGQMFMTHCRSHWGRGSTTHVAQGGHYWNQVNGGYAPFISSAGIPQQPAMQNYMLASARYGHGEGGAGKRGSREVYGGHSHVGTMIYLGNNWPAEYRNNVFSHNLHGHQLNQQRNVREGGGYNTVHAGNDALFCADRQYIGVDLKYGPDGAVYISDWYDPRHCHNPNVEHWDRGNGRMYRMQFNATYQPVTVDYTKATDEQLVAAQLHPNDWHVRMARLVLSERSANGGISAQAISQLRSMVTDQQQPARQLRALWALHAATAIDAKLVGQLLNDPSEYVRAWTVQLAVESLPVADISQPLQQLTQRETSLFVRRYLASAIQRVPDDLGWFIAETLSSQADNAADRELPLQLWYGIAGLMHNDLDRALAVAGSTQLPVLRDYVHWYAAKLSDKGRDAVTHELANAAPTDQVRLLSLFELGVRGMRGLPSPQGWAALAPQLYDSPDAGTRRAAESLGAAFGDEALYQRMRMQLADDKAALPAKQHALSVLASDSSPENLPYFLKLVDNKPLTTQVLPLLTRFNSPVVAETLLARLPDWNDGESKAAMEVLSSRASWAEKVLDAIASGQLQKSQLTAYYVRQMSNLGNSQLNERLEAEWGSVGQSSEELAAQIRQLSESYSSAPLWAYSAQAGSAHFKKLCAACHQPDQQNEAIAPKLAGSGSKGIGYIVENVLDPNAVIGRDFQARIIVTQDGRAINGLVESETDSAITIRTATNSVTVARDDIDEIAISPNSFMPEGLLKTLNDREQIELFKYLMSL